MQEYCRMRGRTWTRAMSCKVEFWRHVRQSSLHYPQHSSYEYNREVLEYCSSGVDAGPCANEALETMQGLRMHGAAGRRVESGRPRGCDCKGEPHRLGCRRPQACHAAGGKVFIPVSLGSHVKRCVTCPKRIRARDCGARLTDCGILCHQKLPRAGLCKNL